MEIIQLGTASIWPAEFSSSFLIDGHILVDCPNGLIKQMKRLDLDILKIDTVLITHFHADHYFDLPLLYLELAFDAVERGAQSCPLTLAGPSGIREQTETLYRLAYADTAQAVYETIPFRYIDLAEYIRQNKWTTAGSWNNGVFDPNDTWEMCINPLPLLTACGNGRGGGDYHDCYPDYDKVGIWAFDLIECTDVCPEDYAQYEPCFTEQREAA